MTCLDLITGSLRLLGVLASGEVPTAPEAQDALTSLNSLVDSWQTERLMVFAVEPVTFPVISGQASYTLGPAGTWATPYPQKVERAKLIYQQNSPLPLTLPLRLIDLEQYQRIGVPATTSTIPTMIYVGDEFPARTVTLYPVPQIVSQVVLDMWQPLTSFAAITDTVAFPPGYERALRFGLALELAPEYGKTPDAVTMSNAQEAKAKIKSVNVKTPLMRVEGVLRGHAGAFNWLTGE